MSTRPESGWKRAKQTYYEWSAARHRASSIRRLRSLEADHSDSSERWRIPFEFRGLGLFKRIRPMQAESEIKGLYSCVAGRRPKVVLEIGTCHGGTLYMWCQAAAPDATLVSLDLPSGEFGGGYPEAREPFYREFRLPGQTLHLVRDDSHSPQAARRIAGLLGETPVDFLFIDGDHTYEGVRQDYELYSGLVVSGGLIALHDIVHRTDQPRIEVWRFWQELKATHVDAKEWIEHLPGQRAIGIGIIERK